MGNDGNEEYSREESERTEGLSEARFARLPGRKDGTSCKTGSREACEEALEAKDEHIVSSMSLWRPKKYIRLST